MPECRVLCILLYMHAHRFLVGLIGILAPIACFAHGSGQTFEQKTDQHFIDIGYDTPFQVGKETLIDFGLFTLKDGEPDGLATFTNLTLTIHSGSSVLYERSIDKPEFGKVFATVTPKREGNWVLTAVFAVPEKPIETMSVDIVIQPPIIQAMSAVPDALIFSVIIAALAVCGFFIFRRPRHSFPEFRA